MNRTALTLLAVIACLAAAAAAKAVLAPLAASLMILALVWPLHAWLQSRLPTALALLGSILVVVLTLSVGLLLAVWAFSTISRDLVSNVGTYQRVIASLDHWLKSFGVTLDALWSGGLSPSWLIRQAQWLAGHINSAVTFLIVCLIYTCLGLPEVAPLNAKLGAAPAGSAQALALAAGREAAAKIRVYMAVRTLMSLITGLLVGLLARSFGLGNPVELGIIAFVLNYIPFVGPFVATLVPTALAAIHLPSWTGVLAIFAGLNIVQSVVGSYVEPRIAGNALAMSPVLVLFAVFFWMFLWGVFGAFIGVPIVIVVLTLCGQIPSARWLARLFDGRREPG